MPGDVDGLPVAAAGVAVADAVGDGTPLVLALADGPDGDAVDCPHAATARTDPASSRPRSRRGRLGSHVHMPGCYQASAGAGRCGLSTADRRLLPCVPGGPLLDRSISGAGALTDLADRAMRALGGHRGRNPLSAHPGSLIVLVLLVALAALLVLAGLEVADDPTPRTLAAAAITADPSLGDRVYATVAGSVSPDYVETFFDANGNGIKDPEELSAEWFYFLVDPISQAGVTVRSPHPPEGIVGDATDLTPATFTGMLRRDERAVSEAKAAAGLGFEDLGLDVSDRYVLEDGRGPANPYLAFGLAATVGLVAGAILVGLSGGYLIYRRSDRPLPEPARTLAVGERIPLRVTGLLRTTTGLVHVREAAGGPGPFPDGGGAPAPPGRRGRPAVVDADRRTP